MRGVVTARITVERAGAGEIRVTITADIRIAVTWGHSWASRARTRHPRAEGARVVRPARRIS